MPNSKYSIKDLENFTDIKSHTIRIWEQRYGLLIPKRTDTNIRFYGEAELKKILNIKLLYDHGFKISKIALLNDSEILETATNIILSIDNETDKRVNDLTLLILSYQKEKIWEFLKNELKTNDLVELYLKLILPLLQKLGELWQVNSINILQEHFFSYLFREFVLHEIQKIEVVELSSKKAMLFLHEQEEHEFGILMYYYMLKKRGYNCFYFGQKVPMRELELAQKSINPEIVVSTFTVKMNEPRFNKIMSQLARMSESAKVLISGSQLIGVEKEIPESIHYLRSIDDFRSLIDSNMQKSN